jgi:hypothetical protein
LKRIALSNTRCISLNRCEIEGNVEQIEGSLQNSFRFVPIDPEISKKYSHTQINTNIIQCLVSMMYYFHTVKNFLKKSYQDPSAASPLLHIEELLKLQGQLAHEMEMTSAYVEARQQPSEWHFEKK